MPQAPSAALLAIALSLSPTKRMALRAEFKALQAAINDTTDLFPNQPEKQSLAGAGAHWGLRHLYVKDLQDPTWPEAETSTYNDVCARFNLTKAEVANRLRMGGGRFTITRHPVGVDRKTRLRPAEYLIMRP